MTGGARIFDVRFKEPIAELYRVVVLYACATVLGVCLIAAGACVLIVACLATAAVLSAQPCVSTDPEALGVSETEASALRVVDAFEGPSSALLTDGGSYV